MKTIIVLSDTHGNMRVINSLREIMAETDYIVHLGDCSRDMSQTTARFPYKTVSVDGNCDFGRRGEATFEVEGKKVLALHGHVQGVKGGLGRLKAHAAERGADLVLYGHTHCADICQSEGVLFVNPGALSRTTAEKSYAYIVVHNGKMFAKIVPIKEKI